MTLMFRVVMVAPTTMASQYLGQAWRGAIILSFVWFLHRWKSNVFTRMLATQSAVGIDRDKLLAFDNLSSVGLFVIGIMALAEACGVAVQSVLTVGGIGGECYQSICYVLCFQFIYDNLQDLIVNIINQHKINLSFGYYNLYVSLSLSLSLSLSIYIYIYIV